MAFDLKSGSAYSYTPPAPTGNNSATSPAKQKFINSLKTPQQPIQTPQADTGALNFGAPPQASMPTPAVPQPTQPSALDSARAAYLTSLTPDANVNSAQTSYLKSLSDNSAVSGAQTKYNDFVTNERLGENALEGQGRGIPLQIVRGQQSKLNTQSQLEAGRLQGDIGIAQGNQTATQNAAKTGLDFATSNAQLAQQKASAQLDFANQDVTTAAASAKANADLALTYTNIAKTQGETLTPAQAAAKADADIKKEAADTQQSYAAAAASLASAAKTKADTNGNPNNANQPGYDSTGTKYTASKAIPEVNAMFKPILGGNGTINSTDYQNAKAWWVGQGLSASDFDAEFSRLIDKSGTNWKSDYSYGSN